MLKICVALMLISIVSVSGQRCFTGYKAYSVNRTMVYETNVTETVCGAGDLCGTYQYYNRTGTDYVYLEVGVCVPQNVSMFFTCGGFIAEQQNANKSMLYQCSFMSCTGDLCNQGINKNTTMTQGPLCNVGTRVYSEDRQTAYYANGTANVQCNPGEFCGTYMYYNNTVNGTVYIEFASCVKPVELPFYGCAALATFPGTTDVSNCDFTTCQDTNNAACNNQVLRPPGSTCSVGYRAYSADRTTVYEDMIKETVCRSGDLCGSYEYYNRTGNVTVFVEVGVCVPQNQSIYYNCISLKQQEQIVMPDSKIFQCMYTPCSGNKCNQALNQNNTLTQGPLCNTGVRVFSEDRKTSKYENVTADQQCQIGDFCGTYMFNNNTKNGTIYTEYGECIPPNELSYHGCDALASFTKANVSQCRFRACQSSQGACNPKFLQAPETCPVPSEEIQLLPGCTITRTLNRTFDCIGYVVADFPYSDNTICRANVDRMVQCMTTVVSDCLSPNCPFILQDIPQIREIFDMVVMHTDRISGIHDVIDMIKSYTGADISQMLTLCPEPEQIDMILKGLNTLQSIIPEGGFNLGEPICDNSIVDDLVKWGIANIRETLMVQDHPQACMLYNKMKTQIKDALTHRCDLGKISDVVEMFLPGYGNLVEKGIMEVLAFLDQLQAPKCEGVPSNFVVCKQGYNAFSEDKTMFYDGNATSLVCSTPGAKCAIFKYMNTSGVTPFALEVGACVPMGQETYFNCDALFPQGNPARTSCNVELCSGSRCSDAKFTPGMSKNVSPPDCTKFYGSQSQCMIRQAWLCDYVTWKFDLLTVWLPRFIEYSKANMVALDGLPSCPEVGTAEFCTNREQFRCVSGSGSCRFCFCGDNMYKDLTGVGQVWRKDYMAWRQILKVINKVTQSTASATCGM